jgi:hypothetical protein
MHANTSLHTQHYTEHADATRQGGHPQSRWPYFSCAPVQAFKGRGRADQGRTGQIVTATGVGRRAESAQGRQLHRSSQVGAGRGRVAGPARSVYRAPAPAKGRAAVRSAGCTTSATTEAGARRHSGQSGIPPQVALCMCGGGNGGGEGVWVGWSVRRWQGFEDVYFLVLGFLLFCAHHEEVRPVAGRAGVAARDVVGRGGMCRP